MIVAHIALVVNTTILVGKCKWPEGQWCSRGGRWSKIHSGISTASLSCPPLPILSTISWSESSLTITSYLRNSNHLLILPTTTYILQNTNNLVSLVNHLLFYHHSVSRTISKPIYFWSELAFSGSERRRQSERLQTCYENHNAVRIKGAN